MANLKVEDVVRINSGKGKVYLALKDGKAHKITAIVAMLRKEGLDHPWAAVYGLGRILKAQFGKQIVVDREASTFQMTAFAKARPAAKKAAAKRKPVKKAASTLVTA